MNSQGCVFLEEGINFDLDTVNDCCIMHNDNRGMPVLIKDYHGEMIDWEALFSTKEERILRQKKATIFECEGCYRIAEYKYKNEKKISEFHFSHSRICNSKCIYCGSTYNFGTQNYDTYPIIKDLIDKGYYKAGGEATMQGGEPTLMKNFENLVDLFIQNGTNIRVHSNAIKYSEKIAEALGQGKGLIVTSLDCASKETYKKIKLVDKYEQVVENLQKYLNASADSVVIKYIIIPGINDNIREIDKFFDLMLNLGVKKVAVDIEVQYATKYENKYVSPHVYLLYDYFEHKAKILDIELLTYSFFVYVLRNRSIKKSRFLTNKFLFDLVLSIHNQKDKNLAYK